MLSVPYIYAKDLSCFVSGEIFFALFVPEMGKARFLLLKQEAGFAFLIERKEKRVNYLLFFFASRKSFSSALMMSVMNI